MAAPAAILAMFFIFFTLKECLDTGKVSYSKMLARNIFLFKALIVK